VTLIVAVVFLLLPLRYIFTLYYQIEAFVYRLLPNVARDNVMLMKHF